ncbi:hypothetical protein SAMD00019534_092410 [Acytostelium subglobosum LB1]|uniref:hypothetical protein n=1 Tax=Acytostelium subglobosum LB1 TaxID=1410327 RepID=UPI0006450F71|nr:hypothetical protein SAMD00019534_092410 [Acytostelium subglobosum LB1]GAM26066.1 hypothetical protein SAMD00019534_092410 [Acytostelium subglobosum LB1]|eukprot:XP_012751109.1 hypothetical protein SAMD00019534_092410 [Acytostelium subglobosum LB1]
MSDTHNIHHQVFHNTLLCRAILNHISDIHKRLGLTSTIKGRLLHSNGDLMMMLKYNATGMFIQSFDSVANNYPINTTLLKCAAEYNNTKAFNHLIKHPNIIIDQAEFKLEHVCQHGNIDILQSYIDSTACHSTHYIDFLTCLPLAINNGNENFVRLLLQHFKSRGSIPRSVGTRGETNHDVGDTTDKDRESPVYLAKDRLYKFRLKRQGVSVDMLRVLHEEFECLFLLHNLFDRVLANSAKHKMSASVQYIMDNLPDDQTTWIDFDHFFRRCAKDGNIEYLRMLNETQQGQRYLKGISKYDGKPAMTALSRGHVEFIEYFNGIMGFGKPKHRGEKEVVRAMAAIYTDDLATAESLIHNIKSLRPKWCHRLSTSMAMLITRPRTTPLVFDIPTLKNMVNAVGKPGSNITVDIVCNFIDNCNLNSNDRWQLKRVVAMAATFSSAVMAHLRARFKLSEKECMGVVLQSRYRDTREVMGGIFGIAESAEGFEYIGKASIDEIKMMLEHSIKYRNYPLICKWAASNQSSEVFEYVIGLFTPSQLHGSKIPGLLEKIVRCALKYDNPEYVQILQRHLGLTDGGQSLLSKLGLSIWKLEKMTTNNAHHSLAFVFNSSTFNNQSKSHRLRLIHHVLHHAYKIGATRLIKLCINHIESLNQLHCDDDPPFTVPLTPLIGNRSISDQHVLERSFHMVIGDTKLVTLIMRHIGLIHSSSKAIKGSTLLNNHKLSDYIKYGATEYLIQAYTSIKQSFPHNTTLLYETFAKCNTIALDALLTNSNMIASFHDGCLAEMSSSFSHPQWDRIVEAYIQITGESFTPTYFWDFLLSTTKHPSIVRKLMDMGVVFTPIEETHVIFEDIDENWFNRPCALETLQLYLKHKILGLSVIQTLITECCEQGRVESFHVLMSLVDDDTDHVDDQVDEDDDDHIEEWLTYFSDQFTRCGHLDIVKRLCSYLQSNDVDLTEHILRAIPNALEHGHFDVFNFLMDVLPSVIIGGGDKPSDDDDENADSVASVGSVHHSIISIDLIKRLNSCPYIMFKANDDCLIQALKTGDTDLIEHYFKELMERKTNYNLGNSFKVAMEVGNVNIARKMIAMLPEMMVTGDHVISLLKSLGGRDAAKDDEVTESTIIEFLRLSQRHHVKDLMEAASNRSLSMIKLVVDHFNSMPKNDVDRMYATDFRQSIDVCAKRCDIQSIDYLIDVAINVDGRNPPDESSTGVRYGWDQHRIHDIITLDVITNSSVLTYFMDKGYINVCDDNDKFNSNALTTIVNNACVSNNLDIILHDLSTMFDTITTPEMSSINVQYQQSSEQQPSQIDLLYV